MIRLNAARAFLAAIFLVNITAIPRKVGAAPQTADYAGVQCQLTEASHTTDHYTAQVMTEGVFIDNPSTSAPPATFICPAIIVTQYPNVQISEITFTPNVTKTTSTTPLAVTCQEFVGLAGGSQTSLTLSGTDHASYPYAERIFFHCWAPGNTKVVVRGYRVSMTYVGN